ncbi:MAG TPA: mechanosensitive ion channel domain-containing protein [Sphingobacteriaceae bacterium]|nr:mechanosensitive ion channel domain-containing protein [Sphingobacteriaceae bacterium]
MDFNWSKELLLNWGVAEDLVIWIHTGILFFIAFIFLYIIDLIFRLVVLRSILRMAKRSSTKFDDYLVANKTFVYISRLILLIIFKNLLPSLLTDFSDSVHFWTTVTDILLLFSWYLIFKSILRSIKDHLSTKEGFKDKPLGSYVQVADIVLIFVLAIILFTLLTGQNPWTFLTALGAASAVAMLVFKDTILGFVASIQVSVNDMVRIGDWIEMPKYNADGDVIEINLNTVKVQNWDKTITTVPTHYLVTDSFKNWRGMHESGGRRIKRAIKIKISSIRYLNGQEIEELKKIQLLAPYIEERKQEIEQFNQKTGADRSMPVNGRNLTNVGLFREYVNRYVRNNPNIRQDMTLLVRQLAPDQHGLPLELYMFTSNTKWAFYENAMSDIFDHLFAAIKYFGLEVFEAPASDDVRGLIIGKSNQQQN